MKTWLLKNVGILLFIISILLGLFTFNQYGVSWDEPQQHNIGEISYNYLFHNDPSLKSFNDRDYGVGFELPLIMIEKALGLKNNRDIYLLRHLMTHLFFLFSAFLGFLLIDFLYKNKLLATFGFLLLVLQPIIYGHSFFNTKDLPFLSMFLICFYLAALAFNKNRYGYFILLGLACGFLMNLRIMGVLMMVSVCMFFMVDFISNTDKKAKTKVFFLLVTFISTTLLALYVSWPYLYEHPIQNFVSAFRNMSNFRFDREVLFFGQSVKATEVKWTYSVGWFLISNPIVYIILGITGIILLVYKVAKNPFAFLYHHAERNNLLYIICFVAPLLAVMVLHSSLYDSWRQLFFIYPPFVLLAIYGLHYLLKTRAKLIFISIIGVSLLSTGYFMVHNFPFQHVYFNQLVRSNKPEYLRKNFDLDYWGVSNKQALEYILDRDTCSKIDIYGSYYSGYILKPEALKRINFVWDVNNAKYFITNYRWHPEDYAYPLSKKYYTIRVLNSSVITVFKLK